MDTPPVEITCQNCKKTYPVKSIVQHVMRSECKSFYTEEDERNLRNYSKELSKAKKALRYQANKDHIAKKKKETYDRNKEQIAKKRKETYDRNKEQIAKKRKETYDRNERSRWYQANKDQIAQRNKRCYDKIERARRYQRNKEIIAKKYDKEQRAKRYRLIMDQIKQNRKELKQNKESKEGYHFNELCKELFYNSYYDIKQGHLHKAYEIVEEREEDRATEIEYDIIERDVWKFSMDNILCCRGYHCVQLNASTGKSLPCKDWVDTEKRRFHEKEFCILHMTKSEWGDLVDDAIEETFHKDFEKQTDEEATDLVRREWKLAFKSNSLMSLPILYSDAAERSCNKAFRTIFTQKYKDIYKKANKAAEDKYRILEEKTDEDKYPEKSFHHILIEELKASENLVSKEIAEIFDRDFVDSIEKEFSNFKDYICWRMRSTNTRRKEWALMSLQEIQKTFDGKPLNDYKRTILEDAQNQIEKAYDNYEEEIADAHENYNVPFSFFCFSETVDLYPNLDFDYYSVSLQHDLETIDTYGALIDELWLQLEVEKEDCVCPICIKDFKERSKWLLFSNCRKLMRQRLKCMPWRTLPYRTCPLCRKNIPKDQFDKKPDQKGGHFISTLTYHLKCTEI